MKNIKGYTEEDINYLINNYKDYSYKQLGNHIKKSSGSIAYAIRTLGLIKQVHKNWTKDEDDFLKSNYLKMSNEEMGKKLNRSFDSISARCQVLGLIKHDNWSEDEINYLKEHYNNMEYKEIGEYLGRSEMAVNAKCFELNLYKKELPWEEWEYDFVRQNYKEMPSGEIAEILHRTQNAVRLKASRMGYKKSPYYCDYHYFDNIDSEEKAYWLGFITADGWTYINEGNNSGTVGIELQYGDIDHLKKFNKSINGNYKITDRWRECKISTIPDKVTHTCAIRIFSIVMCESLKKYGISGEKTYTIKMPKLNEELIRHYLRGYFDGDGRFGLSNNRIWVSFITASEMLNNDLVEFIKSIGVDTAEYSYIDEYGTTMYAPEIKRNKDKMLFLDYIYNNSNIYLDRKYKKYLKAKEIYGSTDGLAA